MTHKLLVVTAGTIAAGVGQEFSRQLKTNPASELQPVVRYIDTADLEKRYPGLRAGDWFHMTIDPQFIDTISRNPDNHPYLKNLLYRSLLPEISGSGGGSIRYNAAGAIAINRNKMKQWLTTSITDLVRSGNGQAKLSIALVVSAVGATGSGTLERLVDMVVECAQNARIPSPVHCDVYILQPGMEGVTELGLSNTLALYAEMASSRLSRTASGSKSRRGRTILVDWGSEHRMASIEQLQETTATLIRLTHDPATAIAAEFQDREVDNHVLREQDWQTHLPSHLSTATAVTISLGDLEEKIIQRDAVLIVDALVFGGKLSEGSSGEYFVSEVNKKEHQVGPLLSTLSNFLQGETPEERYAHLVERLTEVLNISSFQMTAGKLEGMTSQQQANRLRSLWQNDKEEVAKSDRKEIEKQRISLVGSTIKEMIEGRRKAVATGLSLQDLLDEYQEMENILISAQSISLGSRQGAADDNEVLKKISALESSRWGRRPSVPQVLVVIRSNLEQKLQRETHAAALATLKELQAHCAESRLNLQVILQKLYKQRKNNPKWAAANREFRIEMNNLLYMAALSTPDEINRYADLVSVFATKQKKKLTTEEVQDSNPLAGFRKWLNDAGKIDVLFAGEIELLLNLALTYARNYVHNEVENHTVVDVLIQAGEDVLQQRLSDAITKAKSLVSFSHQFATEIREARHVSADWRNDEQHALLEKMINQAPEQCTLLSSKDPSEIVVFYYVDGLPMSAITDLTGRCLDAFLKRRLAWFRQSQLNGNKAEANNKYYQLVGVPVYNGNDAQERVLEAGVIRNLYEVRGQSVESYGSDDLPELAPDTNHQ